MEVQSGMVEVRRETLEVQRAIGDIQMELKGVSEVCVLACFPSNKLNITSRLNEL